MLKYIEFNISEILDTCSKVENICVIIVSIYIYIYTVEVTYNRG
jgi:hypothetical protein